MNNMTIYEAEPKTVSRIAVGPVDHRLPAAKALIRQTTLC